MIEQDINIHALNPHDEVFVFFFEHGEILGNGKQLLKRYPRVIRPALKGGNDGLRCGLACPHRKGGDGTINDIGSRLNRGHITHSGHSACVVAVNLNGQIHFGANSGHQLPNGHRGNQSRHILNTNGVRPHIRHVSGLFGK